MPKENHENSYIDPKNFAKISNEELEILFQFVLEIGEFSQYFMNFINNFSKGVSVTRKKLDTNLWNNLSLFFQIMDYLEESKEYTPRELNFYGNIIAQKIQSDGLQRIKRVNSQEKKNITNKNEIYDKSTKECSTNKGLFSDRDLNSVLKWSVKLKILENFQKDQLKKLQRKYPGRKKEKKKNNNGIQVLPSYENLLSEGGYPSAYKISNEYIILKKISKNKELVPFIINLIINNSNVKKYLECFNKIGMYLLPVVSREVYQNTDGTVQELSEFDSEEWKEKSQKLSEQYINKIIKENDFKALLIIIYLCKILYPKRQKKD